MTEKERIRERFRDGVFKRAGYRCQGVGCAVKATRATAVETLDAHHITDRNEMPRGGYVVENGIALCEACHRKAEAFHETGAALDGWHPHDLYRIVGSSRERAENASRKL
jgi:hypothetical protein